MVILASSCTGKLRPLVVAGLCLAAVAPSAVLSFVVMAPSHPVHHHPSIPTTTTSLAAAEARHDTGGGDESQLSKEDHAAMVAYRDHQSNAPKLDWATDVRTLVAGSHGFAVLSTFSKAEPDFPGGSVVGFAAMPETGEPVCIFSGMSTHTQDILVNPHVSMTIAAKDFKGAADGRVNLMGRMNLIKDKEEKKAAKEVYLAKHPGAFWVEFGDFNWFKLTVDKIRFVGGFARAGSVTQPDYTNAVADPIASQFGPAIAAHMNDDHSDATIAMVQALVPGMMMQGDTNNDEVKITEAIITSVDALGMYIKVTRTAAVAFLPQQFKLRLPFPRPAVDRKDVRTLIVELTQSAASAAEKEG